MELVKGGKSQNCPLQYYIHTTKYHIHLIIFDSFSQPETLQLHNSLQMWGFLY